MTYTIPTPGPDTFSTDIADALERAHATDAHCEDLLFAQAHLLDMLFRRMLSRDIHNMHAKYDDGTPRLDSNALDFAMRAQRQCHNAINTLSVIRKRSAPKT